MKKREQRKTTTIQLDVQQLASVRGGADAAPTRVKCEMYCEEIHVKANQFWA